MTPAPDHFRPPLADILSVEVAPGDPPGPVVETLALLLVKAWRRRLERKREGGDQDHEPAQAEREAATRARARDG
jgi:hypothetical protein